MLGFFKRMIEEVVRENAHQHKYRYHLDHGPIWTEELDIDMTVRFLWEERAGNLKTIERLNFEVAAFHEYWREQTCGDCIHKAVCKNSVKIKFGDKCHEKKEQ